MPERLRVAALRQLIPAATHHVVADERRECLSGPGLQRREVDGHLGENTPHSVAVDPELVVAISHQGILGRSASSDAAPEPQLRVGSFTGIVSVTMLYRNAADGASQWTQGIDDTEESIMQPHTQFMETLLKLAR